MAQSYRSRALIGRRTRRSTVAAILAGSVAPVLAASDAFAVTKTFSSVNQAWLTTTNWTPNGLPTATDDILINAGLPEMTLSNGTIDAQFILFSNLNNRAIGNATGTAGNSTITLHGNGGVNPLISVTGGGTFNIKGPNSGAGTGTLGVVLNASGQLSVSGTGGLTIGAVISETAGPRTLEKVGGGTLTLSGFNTFSGGFDVRDGTVNINTLNNVGTPQALGVGPSTNLGSSTTSGFIVYTGPNTTTDRLFNRSPGGGGISTTNDIDVTSDIGGSGAFTKGGTGRLILSGPLGRISGSGSITVAGGTLRLDNTTNNDDRLGGSGSLNMNHGTFTFVGNSDVGTAESYNALNITGGSNKLTTETVGVLGNVAAMTFSSFSRTGGIVDFNSAGTTFLQIASGPTHVNGIVGGYATFGGNDWATVSGTIVGGYAGYTTDSAPGTWAATENINLTTGAILTVSADTTINTLRFADLGASVSIDSLKTLTVDSGGILATGTSGAAIGGVGSIAPGAGNEIFVHVPDAANTLGVTAQFVNGAGVTNLVKAGAGVLITDGSNQFTGSADVLAGTLRMGANGFLSANTVNVSRGATFDLNSQTKTIGGLSGAGAVTLGSGTLSFGANNSSTTHSGVISGTGDITKLGTGTVALTGVNTFSGKTNIGNTNGIDAGGVLVVDADSRFGAVPGAATPGKINLYNGTLRLTGGTGITTVITSGGTQGVRGVLVNINRGVTLNPGNGKIEVPTNEYAEIPGIIADGTGTSPLHKIGGGILDLRTSGNSNNTFTGGVIVDGGVLGVVKDGNFGAVPGAVDFDAVQLNNGATIRWYSNTVAGLAANRGLTIGTGGGIVDWSHSAGVPLINHPITSAVGNTLTKVGTNTTQSNIAQPTMNGDLIVGQGRWNTHNDTAAGTGTINLNAPDIAPTTAAGLAQLGIGGTNLGLTITLANNIVLNPTGQGLTSFEVNNSTPTQNTLTLNGVISGTGGLAKGRTAGTTGILALGGNNTYTGETTVLLGTLQVTNNTNLGNAANGVTLGGSGAAATLKLAGNVSGGRTLTTASGGGVVDTNGFNATFGNSVGTANLVKNSAGTLTVNHARVNNLTINGGTMAIAPSSLAAGVSKVAALTIAAGARIDLTDNKLITTTAAGTESGGIYSGVQGMVQAASNGGAWDQPGLTTSQGDAAGGLTSIGVATGEQILGLGPTDTALFAGQTITGASTVAMYTYAGDANMDGFISGDDYAAIDLNVAIPGSDGWYNGDFNYDGIISGDDYAAIDLNIVIQGAPFFTSGGASLSGVTAVPEPASLGVVGLATASMLGRRRRRS